MSALLLPKKIDDAVQDNTLSPRSKTVSSVAATELML